MKKHRYEFVEIKELLSKFDLPDFMINKLAGIIYGLTNDERENLSIVLNLMSWNTKKIIK